MAISRWIRNGRPRPHADWMTRAAASKMKRSYVLFCLLLLSAFAVGAAAQNAPEPSPTPIPISEGIIRISSNLVLVDALVLDKNNSQVKDLSAEDFEVFQDGRIQKITTFSYIDNAASLAAEAPEDGERKDNTPIPVSVRGRTAGRIITFVIDDGNCLSTIAGTATARKSVGKFIDEKMRPDDKVAIYRTRGGSSLLQMYTSDKNALKRVVKKINWTPSQCGSAFEAARDKSTIKITGSGASSFESESDREAQKLITDAERDNRVIGSVGVLGFVIDRLRSLPRRKLVFFISEGVPIPFGSRGFDALREISDKASRSSVVIYTMSAKGLTVTGFTSAQDEVLPGIVTGNDDTYALTESRNEEERALNDGLSYLAYATGGRFLRNKNFLEQTVEKVLDRESGYYLLGYEPESETFKGREYHRIEVRLKRPGLRISSRKGFIGREEKEARAGGKGSMNPLYRAIASPFSKNNMQIRLTALVRSSAGKGSFVRALFHLRGRDLTFADAPGGLKKAVLDVVLVVLDEKGNVINEFNRTYPLRIPKDAVGLVKRNGLDYSTDLPVGKPGFYSIRLAVQERGSKRLGSAGDYIEIPKLRKKGFFISGLVTTPITKSNKPLIPKRRGLKEGFAPVYIKGIPSIRQYSAGSPLAYIYDIYNARTDRRTGRPRLSSRLRLYKDGKLLVDGAETPVELVSGPKGARIADYGFLRLSPQAETGEYALQLIVTDLIAKKTSSDWIDFEVIE